MAEMAPLTSAHTHARKAAEETQNINWLEAANEHQDAAIDFARASKSTNDSEALRILRLLEEQHKRLARIIKTQESEDQVHVEDAPGEDSLKKDTSITRRDFAASNKPSTPKEQAISSAPTKPSRSGAQVRESSPSLAREIASRRGIPQTGRTPPSAAAQARARQLSPESHRRNRNNQQAKIPPSIMESQQLQTARKVKKVEDDDAFAKFYSNLTTGTMSKLSSVLAYAGLPLTAEDAVNEQYKQKAKKDTVSASNEPDVKKIFSKAALSAIEDEHRQRGSQGRVFGPAESFYVVPTGGGTYSYANIAKPVQQHHTAIDEDDEEAFVDAREAQASSPKSSRFSSRSISGKGKTAEEIELENKTLKSTLMELTQRLSGFEMHSQDASMAALTQSMASLNNYGGLGTTAGGANDAGLSERVQHLERQLEAKTEEQQRLLNTNAKQEKMLKKYSARWEEIKKSAQEKEKAKRVKMEGEKGGSGEAE
ncbi:unnamed protein product [Zymoseptoria tritici ST99CH_3D7]|uniref:MIT domain-containing protein n=1 Tax=Zymoseptoria tritici (strain ST99CH_3D7) TaxID=1276538 RepID=A0A1X7RM73_ZYMT9|nr:unnamed protein product [Zymoseptoria tritici ST99CH_3D7]